jgi:DNA-binding CsgD family transcriptional regulator
LNTDQINSPDISIEAIYLVRILHNYSNHCVVGINPRQLLDRARVDQRADEPGPRSQKTARQLRVTEVDRLVTRYKEAKNIRRVAAEFKMSRTTVAKHLADRGIVTTKRMNAAQVSQAIELYADGLSSMTIGKQLGFDNHTIIKALRTSGVTIRSALGH